ncbi:hypothetical protein BACCIP111883_02082 [Sutcliffiella rhizosphaerae]|uniref:Uncharacterized protein n=1 Tax=Sutcliffiella rhizosphaerae TaxID=2880967 RepID=A0ABN8AEQ7_9BACI|nr:hypothetical protein BACCIP111883_02082 [Sutcliffiella rhizosphaerae]
MREASGLASLAEMAMALRTYIGALNRDYAREDLCERLISVVQTDIFLPVEDYTSLFLSDKLLGLLGSRGATHLYYHDPILEKRGKHEIKTIDPVSFQGLAHKELLVSDENNDFAFMVEFDSFETILMYKGESLEEFIKAVNVEAKICRESTYVNWYLDDLEINN